MLSDFSPKIFFLLNGVFFRGLPFLFGIFILFFLFFGVLLCIEVLLDLVDLFDLLLIILGLLSGLFSTLVKLFEGLLLIVL